MAPRRLPRVRSAAPPFPDHPAGDAPAHALAFDPDGRCISCAYPVELWMTRCPECGQPIIPVPASTPRADRIAEQVVTAAFAAYALIYIGLALGV